VTITICKELSLYEQCLQKNEVNKKRKIHNIYVFLVNNELLLNVIVGIFKLLIHFKFTFEIYENTELRSGS
jgi:hypothetical protein